MMKRGVRESLVMGSLIIAHDIGPFYWLSPGIGCTSAEGGDRGRRKEEEEKKEKMVTFLK